MPDREVGAHRDDSETPRLLGELIAEVRALKHNTANNTQRLDALGTIASHQTEIMHRMERFEKEQERHHSRIAVLEADKNRREGAIGLVAWTSRHWPFTVIFAALAAFIAWANGVEVK